MPLESIDSIGLFYNINGMNVHSYIRHKVCEDKL
ncbi:hypothetical protein gpAD87_13300 [Paenibacillus sp. AD87]|nr:hypothetical protein gpAD87_13300 [Paenibacillus sp. AD87]